MLYRGLRDGSYGAPGEWTLKRCNAAECAALWLDPEPLAEDLLLAYENYYTHDAADTDAGGVFKRIYRLFADALLGATGILAERRRTESMFLDGEPPATLLDVGCGHGGFLARMAHRGWTVRGVDFDPEAVTAARTQRGLDVSVGGIEAVPEAAKFDVITASHVIEHVRDPLDFLKECRRRLKPGGRLILRTPNANSFGHRRYREAWRGLEPPRHLCILTADALVATARRAGLDTRECFTSYAMAESVLIASHFLSKTGVFDPRHQPVSQFIVWKLLGPLLGVRAKISWLLDRSNGEEICAVLQRGYPASAD